jgi:glutamyl-tRNA reductase
MSFEMLPNESLESWAQRVERYEYGRALMKLAQGDDPVVVAQETSRRIVNKLQHPVIAAIHDTVINNYEPESSLEDYRRNYLDRVGPKADHIREHP